MHFYPASVLKTIHPWCKTKNQCQCNISNPQKIVVVQRFTEATNRSHLPCYRSNWRATASTSTSTSTTTRRWPRCWTARVCRTARCRRPTRRATSKSSAPSSSGWNAYSPRGTLVWPPPDSRSVLFLLLWREFIKYCWEIYLPLPPPFPPRLIVLILQSIYKNIYPIPR